MTKSLIILMLAYFISACNLNEVVPETETPDVNNTLLAKQAYARQNYDVARHHYEIIIKDHPDYIEGLFRLGNIAMREDKLDKAQDYFNRIIKIRPAHAKTHHNLAILYLKQANKHLNYYIANDEASDNEAISRLMNAVDRYADSRAPQKTDLDALAELVNSD